MEAKKKKRLTVKDKNEILAKEGKQILNYGVKLCLNPTNAQKELIHKTFGCSRLAYNKYLGERKEFYSNEGKTLFVNNYKTEIFNPLKQEDSYFYLKEVDKFALEAALENVDDAFKRFCSKQNGFPKFKSKKKAKKSYTTKLTKNNISINLESNILKLPKLGKVAFFTPKSKKNLGKFYNLGRENIRITKATISQVGKNYFASLCIEEIIPKIEKIALEDIDKSKVLGIDLGLTDLIISSNNVKYANQRYLNKNLKKLAKLQRKFSKMKKGSNRWEKQKLKINKLHTHIANSRKDYNHKLSRTLVNENQVIIAETLNIKGMVKNRKLAKAINDTGWYQLLQFIKYKLEWEGKYFVQVDRFFASSKLCSHCGEKNIMLTLKDRTWTCSSCNTNVDRDINASYNIKNEGMRILGIA